jgi:aromatic ring-opening dioxygenase LigB subunit
MEKPTDDLINAICHRRDQEALALIEKNPDLIDENIIRLTLDHSCVNVIRYLRKKNMITMEGKETRDLERLNEFNGKISRFNHNFTEIEKHLK